LLGPELEVDNDVNWAALADHHDGSASDVDDFYYCHLGHGFGGAVVWAGEVVRAVGVSLVRSPTSRPVVLRADQMRLIECFAAWDLLGAGSSTIHVAKVRDVLEGGSAGHRRIRDGVVLAIAKAVASVTALLNPSAVILGGPSSDAADFSDRLRERVQATAVVDTEVRSAQLGPPAPLIGARIAAGRSARQGLLARTPVRSGSRHEYVQSIGRLVLPAGKEVARMDRSTVTPLFGGR
jgi:predicted NBD/HSP70 family sugar kinase